jgi:hypothetical protein
MQISDGLRGVTAFWVVALLLAISGCDGRTTAAEGLQPGVRAVVSEALFAWQQADWEKMYQTLSSADRQLESLQSFQEKRERLHKAQQLKSFRIGEIVRAAEETFRVDVVLEIEENYNSGYRSGLEPRISETTANWTVVEEEDSYRITFVAQELPKEN